MSINQDSHDAQAVQTECRKKNKTVLSIIIPVYNSEKTIGRTLHSLQVIKDKYREQVQIVVINDGSIDQSLAIIQKSTGSLDNFSICIHRQENQGVSAARNSGLKLAEGQWIFFLDADDVLITDPMPWLTDTKKSHNITCFRFAIQIKREKQANISHSPGNKVKTIKPILFSNEKFLDVLTSKNPCPVCSLIFLRCKIQSSFSVDFSRLEDWLFLFENQDIFDHTKVVADVCLSQVYIHETNATSNYQEWGENRQRVSNLILKKFGESFNSKQRNNLLLQIACGRCQAGARWPTIRDFFRFPVSIVLYIKYLIYTASAFFQYKATSYK